METYSLAVIGCGFGGTLSMEAAFRSSRFELVAASDLREESRQAAAANFPGLRTFATVEEMMAACPAEVVCVSTYPPSHEELTLEVLRHQPRGLLVEKPLGHTTASGERLLGAIREAGLPVAVPHGLLTHRTGVAVLDHLRAGAIGKLRTFEMQCHSWDLMNAGIHWLQYFLTCLGEDAVTAVAASVDTSSQTYRDGLQVETNAYTIVETKNGVRGYFNTGDFVVCSDPGKDTFFRLVGDRGQIEFYGWEAGYRLVNRDHPDGTEVEAEPLAAPGHQGHLEALAAQIDHGTPDYRVAETSLEALRIIEAAYASDRSGRRIEYPFDPEASLPPPPQWEPGEPHRPEMGGRDGKLLYRG